MSDYERITSPQNARLKDVARLRQRRGRERQQRILIDGRREIERALEANVLIHELFVGEAFRATLATKRFASLSPKTRVALLPDELLDRIAYGDRNEGLVAVATPPNRTLERFVLPDSPLIAILQGVEKPGNVGAVIRSADAAGLDAVIVADGVTDLFNPNAIRASLGTLFSMQVCSTSSDELIPWLERSDICPVVARVDGAVWYDDFDYRSAVAIVLGSEAEGVSDRWKQDGFSAIKLPMLGVADSLNVSATAAVTFYEANRQRRASQL